MLKKINKKDLLIISAFTILAFLIRIIFFNNVNGDMVNYLVPWIEKIKDLGKIESLKYTIGNYNTPYILILTIISYLPISKNGQYMSAIKIVSVLFDYIMAISTMILTYKLTNNKKKSILSYIIVLLLPTVISNSSAWGQCDSIYTSFIIISLICLVEYKFKYSMMFLGIAFSFKLQTILIMPLYLYILLSKNEKKLKWQDGTVFLLTFFAMGIPSLIMGKSIFDTYSIYFTQTSEHQELFTLNYYNYYTLLSPDKFGEIHYLVNDAFNYIGIGILLVGFALSFLFVIYKKIKISNKQIIEIGVWCIIFTTFFLPRMHERYAYVADVLSIVYLMVYGKKRILVPILIQAVSFTGYVKSCYFYYCPEMSKVASAINLISLIIISILLLKDFNVIKFSKKKTNRQKKITE